jgi:hypothetical protein
MVDEAADGANHPCVEAEGGVFAQEVVKGHDVLVRRSHVLLDASEDLARVLANEGAAPEEEVKARSRRDQGEMIAR